MEEDADLNERESWIVEQSEKYQQFFTFLNKEHNLTLTISEMDEIRYEVNKLNNQLKQD